MKEYEIIKEIAELDAWIAENVMGWKRVKTIHHLDHANRFAIDGNTFNVWRHWPTGTTKMRLFNPTIHSAWAMEVLKKCMERHGSVEIYGGATTPKVFTIHTGNPKRFGAFYVEAETLELAICLFAKKIFTK